MDSKAVAGDYVRLSQLAFLVVREPVAAEVVAVDAILAALRPSVAPDAPPGIQRARRKLVRGSITFLRRRRLLRALPWVKPRLAELELPEAAARTWAALGALPVRQQVAVALARFEGATLAEISDALDCSASAANTYLERAAAALAKSLGPGDLRQVLTRELRTVADAFGHEYRPDPATAELAARRSARWRAWGIALGAVAVGAAAAVVNALRS